MIEKEFRIENIDYDKLKVIILKEEFKLSRIEDQKIFIFDNISISDKNNVDLIRVREVNFNGKTKSTFTVKFKLNNIDKRIEVREELETKISRSDIFIESLIKIGFSVHSILFKKREIYIRKGYANICIDKMENRKFYCEVENAREDLILKTINLIIDKDIYD